MSRMSVTSSGSCSVSFACFVCVFSLRLSIRRAGLESCSSMTAVLFEHDCDPAVNPAYEPYHDPYGCDVIRLVIRLLCVVARVRLRRCSLCLCIRRAGLESCSSLRAFVFSL